MSDGTTTWCGVRPRAGIAGALLVSMVAIFLPATTARAGDLYDPFFAVQATVADFGATTRPFGVASGDYDRDGRVDLVVGRTTGNVAFVKGNGDGTTGAPIVFPWKQAFFNAWSFAPADIDGDGNLDVVWGANATSGGCSVSPVPAEGCPETVTVADGDVRAFLGNGDGTFRQTAYFVAGVRHNAGVLLGRIGSSDAGSVAASDVDGDGDADVVAGGLDGSTSVVKVLRNAGDGTFSQSTLVAQATSCASPCSPIYFPAISTQNSPWGLAFGDIDGDGDADLWVADRALYVYLYENDGSGAFTLRTANAAVSGRPNVYLGHDTFRAAVGFTPSLASSDLNGDGKADLVLGLHSGTQTPASNTRNDGAILLDVSDANRHRSFGTLGDIGTMARGLTIADADGDGAGDIVAGEYGGRVKLLRQLPPLDSDADGISDYVDNAPNHANAPRVDMNDDGSWNHTDQQDNDFDTVLGDPESPATWRRLGDPADDDDDNDALIDADDKCVFTADPAQLDVDGDGRGDVCDPLDGRDADGDGVPDGPQPEDPDYAAAFAAKKKWAEGDTHFVLRIDALGRFFQNEFTQLMMDAATLSPEGWAAKCWEDYDPGDAPSTSRADPTYEPCGTGEGSPSQELTLPGGKELPVTLVTIPKQLWTDAPVIAWINDRNDSPLFELGQHGTYHDSNTGLGDWATATDGRTSFSCETCGLSEAENFELLKIGYDTLMGDYSNKWIAETGGDASDPKIDWGSSATPLISYAPPFNTSDTMSRNAMAQLGFKSFSASVHEEEGYEGYPENFFSPEGSHQEKFDQFGVFHASADHEVEPPETVDGSYDPIEYGDYLASVTEDGALNTWLIEEVEWSGRPCNDDDRVTGPTRAAAPVTCAEGIALGAPNNRENNTVYMPRWNGWMQLLDHVRGYDGGVVMTMGEVALAHGIDNAPTVANPGQADSDGDGIGDVIEGATLVASAASLRRNQPGELAATLTNADGAAIADQTVGFGFDADGDGAEETYVSKTGADGVATAMVTTTRPVGSHPYNVRWVGGHGVSANAVGMAEVTDATFLTLDPMPTTGQVTDQVTVGAVLVDSDGAAVAGEEIAFSIGSASGVGTTDPSGYASATITLAPPAGVQTLTAAFDGAAFLTGASASRSFDVAREDTSLVLGDAVATRNSPAVARAVLTEADGGAVTAVTVDFYVENRVRGVPTWELVGSATTGPDGVASLEIPMRYVSAVKRPLMAGFNGDTSFLASHDDAFVYRDRPGDPPG